MPAAAWEPSGVGRLPHARQRKETVVHYVYKYWTVERRIRNLGINASQKNSHAA